MLTTVYKTPATERQTRELSPIKDPEERKEVWKEIAENHKPQEIIANIPGVHGGTNGFTVQALELPRLLFWHYGGCSIACSSMESHGE